MWHPHEVTIKSVLRTTGALFGIDADAGEWFLSSSLAALSARDSSKYLAHGALPSANASTTVGARTALVWRSLELNVTASGRASASVDGVSVLTSFDISRAVPPRGSTGIGTGQYGSTYFDSLSLRAEPATPAPPPGPKPLPPPDPPKNGTCDHVRAGSPINVRGCQSDPKAPSQSWTFHANGSIGLSSKGVEDLCLALAQPSSGCSGTCVELAPCATAPIWKRGASGGAEEAKIVLQRPSVASHAQPSSAQSVEESTMVPTSNDVCLDVDGVAPTTRVEAYPCNDAFHGGNNERWDYDEATGIISSRLFGSETSCMMAC